MNSLSIEQLGSSIDDSFFMIGVAILLIELVHGLFSKTLKSRGFADMLASASTQIPFLLVEIFVLSFAYSIYVLVHERYVSWSFDINVVSIIFAVIIADFFYYWEHRIAHVVRVLWVQHAVHHSSRHMNIVTGIRFGSFEGIWSMVTMFPMLLIGFAPELIIFGNLVVLAYQTWVHTELIGKLGPVEWVMNTPSHHRVHHGCDKQYMDKNYGGIFIVRDRLFGSFKEEQEAPHYGLAQDFNSVNPLRVWFSEFPELLTDIVNAKSVYELRKRLFARPGWLPDAD